MCVNVRNVVSLAEYLTLFLSADVRVLYVLYCAFVRSTLSPVICTHIYRTRVCLSCLPTCVTLTDCPVRNPAEPAQTAFLWIQITLSSPSPREETKRSMAASDRIESKTFAWCIADRYWLGQLKSQDQQTHLAVYGWVIFSASLSVKRA